MGWARWSVMSLVFCALMTSCTHTNHASRHFAEQRARINAIGREEEAVIRTFGADSVLRIHEGTSFTINVDSSHWSPKGGQGLVSVSTRDVVDVRFSYWGRGISEGLALGSGIGFLVGFSAAIPNLSSTSDFAAIGAAIFTGAGILLGAVVGPVVGGLLGSDDVFILKRIKEWY
jgi:hypothetical protein